MFGCVSATSAPTVEDFLEAFSVFLVLLGIETLVQILNEQFLLLSGYSL